MKLEQKKQLNQAERHILEIMKAIKSINEMIDLHFKEVTSSSNLN